MDERGRRHLLGVVAKVGGLTASSTPLHAHQCNPPYLWTNSWHSVRRRLQDLLLLCQLILEDVLEDVLLLELELLLQLQ